MPPHLTWLVVVGLASALNGCSKSAPPPGKAVAVDQICNEAEASRVRVTGYVRYRRGLLSFCSTYGGHKTCDLALYATAEAPQDFNVMRPRTGPEPAYASLSVPVGDRPGEMVELPEKFTAADIRLHLPNDATAPEGAHVAIDGTLSVIPGDPTKPAAARACFVKVEWATAM